MRFPLFFTHTCHSSNVLVPIYRLHLCLNLYAGSKILSSFDTEAILPLVTYSMILIYAHESNVGGKLEQPRKGREKTLSGNGEQYGSSKGKNL